MKKTLLILFIFLTTMLQAQVITTKVVRIATDSTVFGSGVQAHVLIINASTYAVWESVKGLAPTLSLRDLDSTQIFKVSISKGQSQQILDNQASIVTINDSLFVIRNDVNNNTDTIRVLRGDVNALVDSSFATKVALQDTAASLRADKLNISDTASMLLPYHSNVFKFELTKNDTIIDLGVSLKSGALTFLNGILLKPSQWNVSGNSVLLLLNIQNYDNLIIKN